MKPRYSLRVRVAQRLRVSPALLYSTTGAALAGVICLVAFFWGNFGNNTSAVANKTAEKTQISAPAEMETILERPEIAENPAIATPTLEANVPPVVPGGVTVNGIFYSGATIKWSSNAEGKLDYNVRLREAGTQQWTLITVKSKLKRLNDLKSNTTYELQVQSVNKAAETSDWSELQTFTTTFACGSVNNLSMSSLTSYTAMAHWLGDPNAAQYSIHYREAGQLQWSDEYTLDNHAKRFLFTDLKPGTIYECEVRNQCAFADDWSPYKSTTFTTPRKDEVSETLTPESNRQIKISPNPSAGQFTVELNLARLNVTSARMEMSTLAGQVMLKETMAVENNFIYEGMSFGRELPSGFYLLKITAGEHQYQTQVYIAR